MDEETRKRFEAVEKRLDLLEGKSAEKKQTFSRKKQSLTDHVISLRDTGFFSSPKVSEEVHKELEGVYSCELKRVGVTLLRISNKRELRKTSKLIDSKKRKAYVW